MVLGASFYESYMAKNESQNFKPLPYHPSPPSMPQKWFFGMQLKGSDSDIISLLLCERVGGL